MERKWKEREGKGSGGFPTFVSNIEGWIISGWLLRFAERNKAPRPQVLHPFCQPLKFNGESCLRLTNRPPPPFDHSTRCSYQPTPKLFHHQNFLLSFTYIFFSFLFFFLLLLSFHFHNPSPTYNIHIFIDWRIIERINFFFLPSHFFLSLFLFLLFFFFWFLFCFFLSKIPSYSFQNSPKKRIFNVSRRTKFFSLSLSLSKSK